MMEMVKRFFMMLNFLTMEEEGQGLAEYALILVLVAVVCIAALLFLGGSINNVLCNVGARINAAPGS